MPLRRCVDSMHVPRVRSRCRCGKESGRSLSQRHRVRVHGPAIMRWDCNLLTDRGSGDGLNPVPKSSSSTVWHGHRHSLGVEESQQPLEVDRLDVLEDDRVLVRVPLLRPLAGAQREHGRKHERVPSEEEAVHSEERLLDLCGGASGCMYIIALRCGRGGRDKTHARAGGRRKAFQRRRPAFSEAVCGDIHVRGRRPRPARPRNTGLRAVRG